MYGRQSLCLSAPEGARSCLYGLPWTFLTVVTDYFIQEWEGGVW